MDNLSVQEVKQIRDATFILIDFLRAMIPLMTPKDLEAFKGFIEVSNERLLTKEEFEQFHLLVEKFSPKEDA